MIETFYADIQKQIKSLRTLLNDDNRILLITHRGCMDGHGCKMIMEKYFTNVFTVKLAPTDIDEYIENLRDETFDTVIFADICTSNKTFLKKPNVIAIDHHASNLDLLDVENNTFIYNLDCGTKLLTRLLEAVTKKPRKQYSDLVDLINDYDLWIHADERSQKIAKMFYANGEHEFTERFFNFKVKLTDEEESWYQGELDNIERLYNETDIFELEGLNVGIMMCTEYINDICHKAMNEDNFDIIICYNTSSKSVSVRNKHDEVDVGEMLSKLGIGGGHDSAGGFRAINEKEFKEKIGYIEKYCKRFYKFLII